MKTFTLNQTKNLLTHLPPGSTIELTKLRTGEIAVRENENGVKSKADILKEKYANLIGQPITVSEAAEKYGVHRRTIHKWREKGYITILDPGHQLLLDEAEVKYCVDVYNKKKETGLGYRGPLLDKNGLSYELKHPELAQYRRRQKGQNS